ncbi:MAG: hypothetical protein ABSA42_03075 [Terracidiphilus sp.]|jgi:hypothetical protein
MSRQLEHIESRREAATRIAFEAKLLKFCEFHHEFYSAGEIDYTPGYKLGNHMITKGEFPGVFDADDRIAMAETVKKVVELAPEECFICEKHRDV